MPIIVVLILFGLFSPLWVPAALLAILGLGMCTAEKGCLLGAVALLASFVMMFIGMV
jgi:hypothetical protein